MGILDHIIVIADHPSCTADSAFELMISWIWKLCCLMNSAWTTNSAYVWWLLMNRYCLTRPLHEGEEIISNDIIDISWRLLHLNPGFCLWMTTQEPEPYKPDSLIEGEDLKSNDIKNIIPDDNCINPGFFLWMNDQKKMITNELMTVMTAPGIYLMNILLMMIRK